MSDKKHITKNADWYFWKEGEPASSSSSDDELYLVQDYEKDRFNKIANITKVIASGVLNYDSIKLPESNEEIKLSNSKEDAKSLSSNENIELSNEENPNNSSEECHNIINNLILAGNRMGHLSDYSSNELMLF